MGKKRKPRTLGVLLEAFVGMEVVLELKTDAQVLGYVEWADGGMKCVPRCARVLLTIVLTSGVVN